MKVFTLRCRRDNNDSIILGIYDSEEKAVNRLNELIDEELKDKYCYLLGRVKNKVTLQSDNLRLISYYVDSYEVQ